MLEDLRVPWSARRSNQSVLKEKSVLNIHWKDWYWSWNANTLATWCEELTHWKRPWCWERLRPGEGDDREWDGWMASPTRWIWVWVDSGSCWWTGRPGVLWLMGSQRIGHEWRTKLNWHMISLLRYLFLFFKYKVNDRKWMLLVSEFSTPHSLV